MMTRTIAFGKTMTGPVWIGPLCIIAMFVSVLSGTDRLAFRDVGYFYTPLYDYVAKRCADQPWGALGDAIWNPLDLTGLPLAGETTTAVFYPIRMLVYAGGWSAELSIGIYVVFHLVVASVAAYWLARSHRCCPWTSAIAGLVYPLSGAVLFLATNPPFLVSAAWLPFLLGALLSRDRKPDPLAESSLVAKRRSSRRITIAGLSMSMMILGGDPSTAFHAAIAISLVAAVRFPVQCLVTRQMKWNWRESLIRRLVLVCCTATALSAPQIAASLDWSRQSDRVVDVENEQSKPPTNHRQAQAFSFPIWRISEFAVPNLYGSPWPIHHRWDRIAFDQGIKRPETALWTPSVYVGGWIWLLAPLAIIRLSRLRSGCRDLCTGLGGRSLRIPSSLDWQVIIALALVASMGAYTPLYRFMLDWIPGYDSLRYPSKWLPFVSLSLSLWFAKGSAQILRSRSLTVTIVGTSLAFIAMGTMGWILHQIPYDATTMDVFWGPFQRNLATKSFNVSIIHLTIILAVLTGIIGIGMRRPFALGRKSLLRLLVLVVALDLIIAHHDLIPRINRAMEQTLVRSPSGFERGSRWMNTLPRGGVPPQWKTESSGERMVEVEAALRSSWFGRWHLEHDQSKFNSLVSIRPAQIERFWNMTQEVTKDQTLSQRKTQWRQWESELDIIGSIVREDGEVRWEVSDRLAKQASGNIGYGENPIEFRCEQTAAISRAVYQDGNWYATAAPINNRPLDAVVLEVQPQKWMSQTITVPAGHWRIQWRYAPWWHVPAIIVALLSWSTLVVWLGYCRLPTTVSISVDQPLQSDEPVQ